MKRTFNIEVDLDTKTAEVTGLAFIEGIYDRSEFLTDGIDKPISIYQAAYFIKDQLGSYLEDED